MTQGPGPYDLDDLERLATEAVEDAREFVDEDIGEVLELRVHDFQGREDTVDREEFASFSEDLFDELDELYGVETDEGLRSYLKDRVGYDWTAAEHAKRTGRNSILAGGLVGGAATLVSDNPDVASDALEAAQQEPVLGAAGLAAAAGGVALVNRVTKRIGSGTYVHMPYPVIQHKHRDINISPDAEPAEYAFPVGVAEMTHAYQDIWNSPTFDDPAMEEGMDAGAQLAVADRMDDEDAVWEYDSAWKRCHILAFAYGRLATDHEEHDSIDPDTLEDIGMTPEEAEDAVTAYEEHDSSWNSRATALLGGAGLYTAAQTEGFEVYEEAFHGEYDRLPDWVPYQDG